MKPDLIFENFDLSTEKTEVRRPQGYKLHSWRVTPIGTIIVLWVSLSPS